MKILHVLDDLEIMITENKEIDIKDKNYYLGMIRAIKILMINPEK